MSARAELRTLLSLAGFDRSWRPPWTATVFDAAGGSALLCVLNPASYRLTGTEAAETLRALAQRFQAGEEGMLALRLPSADGIRREVHRWDADGAVFALGDTERVVDVFLAELGHRLVPARAWTPPALDLSDLEEAA